MAQWAMAYGQVELVLLVGAGPPCQGVSGLNSQRKLWDERSCLFTHVQHISALIQAHFPRAQTHTLMESVASMDDKDKAIMSESFGDTPWYCDAGTLTWRRWKSMKICPKWR